MRLGDLDELKKALDEQMNFDENCRDSIFEIIDNAPTVEQETKLVANVTFNKEQLEEIVEKAKANILAQIERPQGEWVVEKNPFGDILHCSICGAKPRRSEYGYYLKDNFCHDCGADMRGKKE